MEKLLIEKFKNKIPDINELLIFCTEHNCSDLHIRVGESPYISRYGLIYRVPTYEMTEKIWNEWATLAISSEGNKEYVTKKMYDFSYVIPMEIDSMKSNAVKLKQKSDIVILGDGSSNIAKLNIKKGEKSDGEKRHTVEYRYRVSAGFSFGKNIAAFRMISMEIPSFSSIHFPNNVQRILEETAKRKSGITLYCGATGNGKTTTMAACINDFTKPGKPFDHFTIITLEDPIEYVYKSNNHVNIIQKELKIDFKEFHLGIKQALREHPNFINVGETRDGETINTLVEAARTGHLVSTSFHSSDVADTISRLYNYLIKDNAGIMYDLISNINVIVCQRLIPNADSFKLDVQYMVFTNEIIKYLINMIEKGKNIPSTIRKLFENRDLISTGIIKNWDHREVYNE